MSSTTELTEITDNEDDEHGFDSSLGSAIADSWWALGKLLAPFHRDERDESKAEAAIAYICQFFEDGTAQWTEDTVNALTPERLRAFAEDLNDLLERKYHGGPIAAEVLSRVRHSSNYTADEAKQFLRLRESPDVWWANEYRVIFNDLAERTEGHAWLEAVTVCANDRCRRFFVKRRPDQRFHSEACRARVANQRSYRKKRSLAKKRGQRQRSM